MQSSSPFISVDYWILKADLAITVKYYNKDPYYKYTHELQQVFQNQINKTPTIFSKTDLLPDYIDILLNTVKNNKYILITASNDDHLIPYINYPPENTSLQQKANQLLNHPNLIKWFTKNPCIVYTKLQGLPLGPKWQWKTTRFFGEDKTTHLTIFNKYCNTPEIQFKNANNQKTKLVYFNYASSTTGNPFYKEHKGIRGKIRNILEKQNKLPYAPTLEYNEYIQELSRCKFSISPVGRGIDAHRTWESLMVGTIPIVMSSPINNLYTTLPVIIIENDIEWNNITPTFLEEKYTELQNKQYDFSILYTPYWDQIIESL